MPLTAWHRHRYFSGEKHIGELCAASIAAAVDFIRALRKPVVITDWDGTLKTYGCQYATCMQDMMSALPIALYATHCTHVTGAKHSASITCDLLSSVAVLTSGPLRNHGITDLTCIPPELGSVVFGGSLGREWWLPRGIIADDKALSTSDQKLLDSIVDEVCFMFSLVQTLHYSSWANCTCMAMIMARTVSSPCLAQAFSASSTASPLAHSLSRSR